MTTRARVPKWLGTLGAIALFLAVMPHFHYRGGASFTPATAEHIKQNRGDLPFTEDYKFGWHFSPLVHRHGERSLAEADGRVSVSESKFTRVGWASWSALTLAVGAGLLVAARRLKPPPKPVS